MAKHLIVTGAFGSYDRGDRIEDPAEVERVLSAAPAHVVAVEAEDSAPQPAPTPMPTPKPAAEPDDPGAVA